jgi:Adenosine specific kinase
MAAATVSFEVVEVVRPEDANVIIGQAHFIKTVEDLHEALAGTSPHLRFGLAFCEASAARLVRRSGNDDELVSLATANAQQIGAGHSFVVLLRHGFPINVMNRSRRFRRYARSSARPPTPSQSSSPSPATAAGSRASSTAHRQSASRPRPTWPPATACCARSATSSDLVVHTRWRRQGGTGKARAPQDHQAFRCPAPRRAQSRSRAGTTRP